MGGLRVVLEWTQNPRPDMGNSKGHGHQEHGPACILERPADLRATSRGMKTQSSSFNPPSRIHSFPALCHSPGKGESFREGEFPKTEKLPERDVCN